MPTTKLWMCIAIAMTVMGCSSKKSEFESQFMGGCVGPDGGRAQKKICACIADKLQAKHSIDELFLLAQLQPGRVLQEAASYAPSCGGRI